ncbi:5-oxoprolinase subunit PxpB (plasmid) [Pantoea sp. C3]|uniref:5-oxoprolinase subunit PxpB n=1 Tax=Pantoea phytostimulans TaxID=2769024 RepID=UPI0038F66BFF
MLSVFESFIDRTSHSSADFVINLAGVGGLLFDASQGKYDSIIQNRIWLLEKYLSELKKELFIREIIIGVNNLLIIFDPLSLSHVKAREILASFWEKTSGETLTGREFEIGVTYGGLAKDDLQDIAASTGLTIDQIISRHSTAIYTVACLGSMPGFAYMTGLPAEIAIPRRQSPRMGILKGSVIIGGEQTGIMPCTAPSGWHLLGETRTEIFNPHANIPCLLSPGDKVRFIVEGVDL